MSQRSRFFTAVTVAAVLAALIIVLTGKSETSPSLSLPRDESRDNFPAQISGEPSDRPDTDSTRNHAYFVPTAGDKDFPPSAFRAECWSQCGSQCLFDSEAAMEIICPAVCESDSECESDELCTVTRSLSDGSRPRRCLGDQCSSHEECGDDQSCIYLGRMEGGIFLCEKAGIRKNGEPCAHNEYSSAGLCERGLHCVNDVCTLDSCITDDDCGLGAKCYTSAGGDGIRSCTASCENDTDCPQGMTCDDYTTSSLPVSPKCVSPANMGCLTSPCGDGLECVVDRDQGSYAITSCMRPCSPATPCGDTEICSDSGYCHTLCGDEEEDCPEGWQRYTAPEDSVSACARDTEAEELQFFEGLAQ